MALTRRYPEALSRDRRETVLSACYTPFYGLDFPLLMLIGVASLFVNAHQPALWGLSTLVLVARSAVVLNQSVNRISFQRRRFKIVECGHAVLGFGLGAIVI